jgi:TonB family protein
MKCFAGLMLVGLTSSCLYSQVVAPIPSRVRMAPETAEKFLIRKVDPIVKCPPMAARVSGTVVVAIEIGAHGEVLTPRIVSGPRMLQESTLNAVRQYKYKPLEIQGHPVKIDTTVLVHFVDICK